MERKTFNKRIVSCIVALALVLSCFVMAVAGAVVDYSGDKGDGKTSLLVTTNGMFTYQIGNAAPRNNYSQYSNSPAQGTVCRFEAPAEFEDSMFMYWIDVYAGRVYSYDRAIQFTTASRMHLRAQFVDVSESTHLVTYVNYGGTILADANKNKGGIYPVGTIVMPPSDNDLPGFTFEQWSKYPADIADDPDDLIIFPQYTVNDETYTVTLTDETYASGAGTYSNFQTVNLKAEEKNGSGQSFSYWQDADGTIISYERNYSFRINYDVTLTPVFGADATPEPVIRISKIYRDTEHTKITFYAERSVPDGYTLVSHGMLMSSGSNITDTAMTISGAGDNEKSAVRKAYGNSNELCGTFSLAKGKIGRNDPVKARPFMILQNADGAQVIVYGDEIRTTNGAAD